MKKILKNLVFTAVSAYVGSFIITMSAMFFFDRVYADPEALVYIVGYVSYSAIFLICIIITVVRAIKEKMNMKSPNEKIV